MEVGKMGLGMATQTGREMERVKEIILEGLELDIVVVLLRETDMVVDLRDPKERDLPLEKLGSTEVVQEEDMVVQEVVQEEDMVDQEEDVVQEEDMCEKEGSIQEVPAPAKDRHSPSRRRRERRTREKRVRAAMSQEEEAEVEEEVEEGLKIGRRHCSLLWEDPHKKETD